MIKLNRLTDYGVVLMARLAREEHRSEDTVLTAGQLAAESGVPAPTVAKILKQLTAAGLVVSQRGAGGGYALSRSAEEITAADIIDVLEGPVLLTACVDGSGDECGVEALCPMRGNWNKVNEAIRHALTEVSLVDMAAPVLPFLDPTRPRPGLSGAL
jgi:FeS assembly SUF system regulator